MTIRLAIALMMFLTTSPTRGLQLSKAEYDHVDTDIYSELIAANPSDEISKKELPGFLQNTGRVVLAENVPSFQRLVDQFYMDLFSVEAGQQACAIFGVNEQAIQNSLGVRKQAAESISKLCKSSPYLSQKHMGHPRANRRYILVPSDVVDTPFDSWTSSTNDTYLIISRALTRKQIYQRLIHEFYISVDIKFLMARETFKALADAEVFSKDAEDFLHKALGITPVPIIKSSFSALRAFGFEYIVLKQLFPDSKPMHFAQKSCWHNLKEIAAALAPHQKLLLPPEIKIQTEVQPQYLYNNEQIEFVLGTLQNGPQALVKSQGRTLDFCTWMAIPLMGTATKHFNRGPRPRVGEGW